MNDNDNRIEPDFQHYLERRQRCRNAAKQKANPDSHQKLLSNKGFKNVCIQRGLRTAKARGWRKIRRGLVYIYNTHTHTPQTTPTDSRYDPTTTPSHTIPYLIQHLPATVKTDRLDDNENNIIMPFQLPVWEKLNDRTRPYFYQLALSELETLSSHEYQLIPFVFTESRSLTKALQGQKKQRVDYLRDQLQKRLKKALNRPDDNPVAFWFAFETARRSQPHIQGSLLLRPDELRKTRSVFHKLNRQATAREKHGAIRFRGSKRKRLFEKRGCLYTDLNWADYNLKERGQTRMQYSRATVAVSQPLSRHTKDYYSRLKAEFDGRKKGTGYSIRFYEGA